MVGNGGNIVFEDIGKHWKIYDSERCKNIGKHWKCWFNLFEKCWGMRGFCCFIKYP